MYVRILLFGWLICNALGAGYVVSDSWSEDMLLPVFLSAAVVGECFLTLFRMRDTYAEQVIRYGLVTCAIMAYFMFPVAPGRDFVSVLALVPAILPFAKLVVAASAWLHDEENELV